MLGKSTSPMDPMGYKSALRVPWETIMERYVSLLGGFTSSPASVDRLNPYILLDGKESNKKNINIPLTYKKLRVWHWPLRVFPNRFRKKNTGTRCATNITINQKDWIHQFKPKIC